MLPPW